MATDPRPPAPDSLQRRFWTRHANPWSGATRIANGPVLVYALYHRRWRLLLASLVFTALNPVLFPPPERTDNWLSEGVLGERAWLADGNHTFGWRYPAVLNTLNVAVFAYTLWAAFRQHPRRTGLAYCLSAALKLLFVDEMCRYYRETRDEYRVASGE